MVSPHDQVSQVAHVRAAVLFWHGNAQQSHLAELAPQIHGKLVVFVDRRGARRNLFLAELVDAIAQHIDVFTEIKIQCGVGGVHRPKSSVRRKSFHSSDC